MTGKRQSKALAPPPAEAIRQVVSVRGLLLTVRQGDTLWVLRSGPDPRAWRKPLDEKGDGIGPWQPCRPTLDSLLRAPGAYAGSGSLLIRDCRRQLEIGLGDSGRKPWEAREEYPEDPEDPDGEVDWNPQRKDSFPFPWACVPRPGERLRRRQAPTPGEISWPGDGEIPARVWWRIPQGQMQWPVQAPPCATDRGFRELRRTIRQVRLLPRLAEWAAQFPGGALDYLERHRFQSRRWHLINLWLRAPDGRELWEEVPALAWLAASSWLCKSDPVQRPFRSLRSLTRQPRSRLLRWLELPPGAGTLSLLRRVDPSRMTPRFAHALRRVLRDEDKRNTLQILPGPIQWRTLRLLAYDLPVSLPVLRAIHEDRRIGDVWREQAILAVYSGCIEMIRVLGQDTELRRELGRIRSLKRLETFHDRLVADIGEVDRGRNPWNDDDRPEEELVGFPCLLAPMAPPLPPPPWMRPLETWEQMQEEGRQMRHCIAGYESEVARGDFYTYAVEHPEYGRASLGIHRTRTGWRVADLRGPRNRVVSSDLAAMIRVWVEQTPPVERPPYEPWALLAETGDAPVPHWHRNDEEWEPEWDAFFDIPF